MALQPCSSALTPRGSSSRLRCLKVQYLQHVLSNNTSMNVEFHTCPYYHGPVSYPAPGTGRRTRSAFGARAAVLLQYYSVLQCTTPVLLCTTKYDSVLESTTPVLLCSTRYYSVLQSTTPVWLLRTTKYYSSTTLYYKVLGVPLHLHCHFSAQRNGYRGSLSLAPWKLMFFNWVAWGH